MEWDGIGMDHEELHVVDGPRSGVPITVAVHSSARGPAVGGCRIRPYAGVDDAVRDALRLSRAMTAKCSLAGLPHGGGKVVAAFDRHAVDANRRDELIQDIAAVIESLDGRYLTGPDMGTTAVDMAVIHQEASGRAFCRPRELGGSDTSGPATVRGVLVALRSAIAHALQVGSVAGLRIGILGFGSVGRGLAESLSTEGAEVLVQDTDETLREVAEHAGLTWSSGGLLTEDLDVLVPAATGGLLDVDTAAACRARIIVGPANDQLADETAADVLRRRGITWIPDVIASAGGIIHAVCREELGYDQHDTDARIDAIETQVVRVTTDADRRGVTTLRAALDLADRPGPYSLLRAKAPDRP